LYYAVSNIHCSMLQHCKTSLQIFLLDTVSELIYLFIYCECCGFDFAVVTTYNVVLVAFYVYFIPYIFMQCSACILCWLITTVYCIMKHSTKKSGCTVLLILADYWLLIANSFIWILCLCTFYISLIMWTIKMIISYRCYCVWCASTHVDWLFCVGLRNVNRHIWQNTSIMLSLLLYVIT